LKNLHYDARSEKHKIIQLDNFFSPRIEI